MRMVVLASGPRVGSSLISDLLTQADAGYASEHFNLYGTVQKVMQENNLKTLQEHFEFIVPKYANDRGDIFTVKCHFDQYVNYCRGVDVVSRFDSLSFIRIRRKETLDQAISYFISKTTGSWSSRGIKDPTAQKMKLKEMVKNAPGGSLYKDIMKMDFRLKQNDFYWNFYLKDIPHSTVYYEDILNPENKRDVEDIFSNIYEKNIKINLQASSLKVQRDDSVSNLIKEKIESHVGKYISPADFNDCMKFNQVFFGGVK